MYSRLIPILALGLIPAALLTAQDRPGQPPTGTGRPGASAGQPGATAALDGTWAVVSAARDGKAVDGADKMTVTIKGNVVTFDTAGTGTGAGSDKAGGPDRGGMRALRLDFGANGTIRVAEAGADGKFGTGSGPGGTGSGTGTAPPAGGTGGAGGAGGAGTLTGVYVMTPDYLAVAVFDNASTGTGGTGTGRPGGSGTTPPAGGTGSGTGTGGTGGTGAAPPAGGTGATGMGPQARTRLSVVLKKSAGSSR